VFTLVEGHELQDGPEAELGHADGNVVAAGNCRERARLGFGGAEDGAREGAVSEQVAAETEREVLLRNHRVLSGIVGAVEEVDDRRLPPAARDSSRDRPHVPGPLDGDGGREELGKVLLVGPDDESASRLNPLDDRLLLGVERGLLRDNDGLEVGEAAGVEAVARQPVVPATATVNGTLPWASSTQMGSILPLPLRAAELL